MRSPLVRRATAGLLLGVAGLAILGAAPPMSSRSAAAPPAAGPPAASKPKPAEPSLLSRWLHNPRERTAAAIAAWERGDFATAEQALEQARAAGEDGDARALFNSGTGHLGNDNLPAAVPDLRAAASQPGPLQGEALYNLGNAALGMGDPAAAADAYRAALRLQPDHSAAKHNLELALEKLEEQKRQQQQQQQPTPGGDKGEQQQQAQPSQNPSDQQQQQQQQQQDKAQDEQAQNGEGQPQPAPQPTPGQQRSSRLPSFDPQKDMSAEQAAALLEAVENLEREQRRAQAEEERRRRAKANVEKDW